MPTRNPGIRHTLLRHLLLQPKPINGEAYKKSFLRLFPSPEVFREFLESDNIEAQVIAAKRILFRLIHHHHFPPPTSLLLNLLEFERRKQGTTAPRGGYIGQDHFVHLVNLYLLGLFFFAYHPELHSRCSQQLNSYRLRFRERKQAEPRPIAELTVPANSYDVFATAWAHFVLYHDLAYPLESITPEGRVSSEENKVILSRYETIFSATLSQLSVKALSNLLVAYSSVQSGQDDILGKMYLSYAPHCFLHGECVAASKSRIWLKPHAGKGSYEIDRNDLLQRWGEARYLPRLKGHTLKATLSIFPDEDACAVLIDESTGDPLVIVLLKVQPDALAERDGENEELADEGLPIAIWLEEKSRRPSSLRAVPLDQLVGSAFGVSRPLGRFLTWHYFGRNVQSYFDSRLDELFGEDAKYFKLLAKKVPSVVDISPDSLRGDNLSGQASFEVFWQLGDGSASRPIKEHRPPLEEVLDSIENSLRSISEEMPLILGEAIQRFFKEAAQAGEINFKEILMQSSLKDALSKLLGYLSRRKKIIEDDLSESLGQRVQDLLDLEEAKTIIKGSIIEGIKESIGDFVASYGFSGREIGKTFSLSDALPDEGDSEVVRRISNRLKALHLPGLKELAAEYRPDFVKGDSQYISEVYVDHGLGGAVLAITLDRLYEGSVQALQSSLRVEDPRRGVLFMRLAFLTQSVAATHLLEFEQRELLEEAILAVTLHNLYPEAIPGRLGPNYKTSVGTEPFAFLCMLADGLQRWDRERQANQGLGMLAPGVYGSRFDIEVRGETIVVSAWGGGTNIDAEKRLLREILDKYLLDVGKIIKLRLSEL